MEATALSRLGGRQKPRFTRLHTHNPPGLVIECLIKELVDVINIGRLVAVMKQYGGLVHVTSIFVLCQIW